MKRNHMRIMGTGALMICMAVVMLFSAFRADASETKEVKYVEGINYTKDNTIPEITDETLKTELEGYLFAGWYTRNEDGKTYNPVSNPVLNNSSYYAKYVPKEVLDIKAQVSGTLCNEITTDDASASIRFVTTIDSTEYKAISFNIKRADKTEAYDAETTNYVYKELYAVDATVANEANLLKTYKPSAFHATSQFFKTWTFSEIPEIAYNTDITVTPFWITLDGTRVEGTTSIKTVNLGRSWVYINTSANTDGTQCGTYAHPFTDLASALEAIVLEKNGRIVIQSDCEDSTFTVPSSFKWEKHGKDLTITGEGEKTETLDFSSIANFRMGDSVTFENMTLKLPTSQLYADGHRFKIAETVNSENSGLIIFGGGNSNDVTGDTNITLLSGNYEAVYGGGLNGDVYGDTHVTIQNASIYSTTGSNTYRYVCGGGRKGDVTGDTYVTVGSGFNTGKEWKKDSYLSAVFGGGYGDADNIATVKGDTYVVIKDGAITNYVHGAGASYSEVQGTSHVTNAGGYAMSIYGGASSSNTVNSNTYVEMTAGTVEAIYGGSNKRNMTGSTDVRLLGGTVQRRVYGGCYNDTDDSSTYHVDGYTMVSIDKSVSLEQLDSLDNSIMAVSRNVVSVPENERGVFIFNDYESNANDEKVGIKDTLGYVKDHAYHYLVKATSGGNVYAAGEQIRIVPNTGYKATVRKTSQTGEIVSYTENEGIYALPELTNETEQMELYVVFTENVPTDVNVSTFEAQINDVYYVTLEDAIYTANTLSTATEAVVVKLLKDVEVESNISVTGNVALENTNAITVTATGTWEDSTDMFTVVSGATLTITGASDDEKITLASGENARYTINNSGTTFLSNVAITGGERGLHNDKGYMGTEDNPLTNVTISGTSGDGVYIYTGYAYMNDITIESAGKRAIAISSGNLEIQSAQLLNSATMGMKVANGTVTMKNTVIDNGGITSVTANRIGIDLSGGTLTLDNVSIQNFVGSSKYNGNHGINQTGGKLIVNANETVDDGNNPGLYIYNVKGHGIFSTGGSLNINKITIAGKSKTIRAGIQLTGNNSSDNQVRNAAITECNAQIQLRNATLTISGVLCTETENKATNYNTDGTK